MPQQLAEAFPPGEYLAEELEERGWTQADLAEILGRPLQLVSEIINGRKEITRETAAQLGAAFGTSAEYWLNLQDLYHLWRHRQDPAKTRELTEVELRAKMNSIAPMGQLRRRGLITATSARDQATELCALLGIATLDDAPDFDAAARRSNATDAPTPLQYVWLACARKATEGMRTSRFDEGGLRALASEIPTMTRNPSTIRQLPALFARVGVALTYVPPFTGGKISGAAFLRKGDPDRPVIAISGLGKRLDKVQFTLLHEAAHLALHHVEPGQPLIDDEDEERSDVEDAADDLAATWLRNSDAAEPPSRVTQAWIDDEARRLGVHPITVVGRLQKLGKIPWRTALVKGAPNVDQYLAEW